MMSGRDLVSRAAPLLACLGLLGLWEIAALVLSTDSFPTAWVAIRAIPSILGDSLPVIYHSFQGAKAVEEKMLWSGAAMGLSAAQRMIRIVLPAALPEILTGCRTGLVLALITMVTSEMIARQSGAGNILFNSLDMGQYETVYAMIIVIGAMGIGLDAAFEMLRARLVRWSEPGFDIPLSFA